jgi:hypothetical protein
VGGAWTSGRIGFVVILAGCAPAPEASSPVQVDLADGFIACDGQIEYLQAFTSEVFELLEQPMPDDLELTLHVLGHDEFEQLGVCVPEAGGCATEAEAWAAGANAEPHEITHMILNELSPWAIAALSEGVAEALGTPSPYWPESTPRPPLASYGSKSAYELDTQERVSAALYTTFLLDEFGPQAYLDLYRSLPRGSSLGDVDARMREHLGASLDALDDRFVDPAEARCMVALAHCGDIYGPVLEPPLELEQSLACDEPGVLGYTAEDGSRRPFRRWQVEIPRDGSYWVEAEGAVINVLRCGSCEERALSYFNGSALMEGTSFALEAGLYTFEVGELFEGHDTFRLVLREDG